MLTLPLSVLLQIGAVRIFATWLLLLLWLFPSYAMAQEILSNSVASVRYLGKQFQDKQLDVTGQDCASSILLPSGDSLWLFGDTIEGPFESVHNLPLKDKLSNTGAIAPPQELSQGVTKFQFLKLPGGQRPRQLVPFTGDEDSAVQRIWPIHGTCVGDQLYVFYHRISLMPGVDVFENFHLDGMGIARAKIGQWDFERLKAPDGSDMFWKGDEPGFGVFVEQREDYVYAWGSLMTGMFLARTRPHVISERDSYEYLVEAPTKDQPSLKARWAKQFAPTAALFDSVPNEMSASFNHHLDCYLAVHSYLRENKIVIRTAPEIVGPWSSEEVIFRPERLGDADLVYAAKEHPELARKNGKIVYITFVNATTYAPEMIEVTFK